MRDLTAQVTSSLLQFPEVTIQALGEDEIILESVLRGKFTAGRNGLACLTCGPQLEVVNSVTGERLSAYRFSGVNEQPPTVLAVKEFSWQKRTGLLIGLEEAEGSVLCLYDLGISRVVKAVVLPGRVTAIEPIINHGGASASTQHLHQSLRWLFGVAAVVTDVGQVLLIDLCLDDLSCSQNEIEASDLEVITGIPAEVPQIRENVTQEGRHLCFQLLSPSGTPISTLSYISRTNQLAAGFSDGYLSLWNMKTLKREYHSQLEGGRIPIYAVTFQEPENDPRNCCYLWAVQSTQESEGDVVSLHLLQLAFGDRKCLASGQILYEGLEYCEERYSLDLTGGVFPLRGQSSNTKLLGCQSIEKFRSHGDREDGMNEVLSPDTSVSVFSWQVNTYGQGKPLTYLGLFDINRWYHAQMPDSLRPGEFLHNCSYFALWSLDAVVSRTSPHHILDILVHERSLSRGVPPSYPPPEQFFNPSSYNFDATCLLNSGVVHLTCTGFQKETLTFLKKSGPSLNEAIPDGYNRCLVAGLLSPRLADVQPSSLSQEEQLEAVLSAAVQTSSLGLLTGCIKRWTTEDQPSSAANLRFILEWTWNKVVYTKEEFDQICVPLFDGSCNFIDPQTIQSLQHCQLLLSNLSTVLNCFLTEAQELTERGLVDLSNKQVVTNLISQYAQVVLWFCRSGLLPEGLDDAMQLSRLCYNYPVIQSYYTGRRQKLERLSRGKWSSDCLMIDGMLSQLGDRVEKLWRRDEGGTGKYPPSSLHALLDLYLQENIDETNKHAITIYLLLDIMYSFPSKTDTSIESFPTAFAVPWGLVKLIQGFWLIDHNDYESALDLLFHPATMKSMSWQHTKIVQAFMCQGEHRRALRYIQTMKPSVSSISEVTLYLTVLLYNRCMIEAWSLLRQHSNRLNLEELLKHLYETCQEMGLMEDLLKLPFTDTEQECLVKFLQSSAGVQNHEFLLVHHLQRANYIPALQLNQSLKVNLMNDRDPQLRERSVARNSILDQYGKILPRVQRKLAMERAKPYQVPSSILREVSRPKPLSTVAKQTTSGTVLTRAAFISNVLSKIGEVWVGNEHKNHFSPYRSPKNEASSPIAHSIPGLELPDAFVGTPITNASQKISRLLDLVVRPVPQPLQRLEFNPQTPSSSLYITSSPLSSTSQHRESPKNVARATELNLLETPLVVKRAKALVTSDNASGFPELPLQSILRSGLRTAPTVSPSASPGRSITPPVRAKETKISFMEEGVTKDWTHRVAEDSKGKEFENLPVHKFGVQTDDMWTKSRDKCAAFATCSPEEDPAEMSRLSQGTTSRSSEKIEDYKETSNVSTRSDQTTLEYQDAPLPDDFEDDVIFIASKPANSSTELIINLPEQTEGDDDKEVLEPEITSSELGEQAGILEDAEIKWPSVPENRISESNHLRSFQVADESPSLSNLEKEIFTQEYQLPILDEEKQLSIETSMPRIELTVEDNEALIGRLDDRKSLAPVASENRLEEEKPLNLNEAYKTEIVVLEEHDLPEEKSSNSSSPLEIQEVHVFEHERVEAQGSEEAGTLTFNELYPSGTLKLQYNFDSIEQQFTCDLPDAKDADCEMAEVDGELFVAQSNFTLILEGEEEIETGNPSDSVVHAKEAHIGPEEEQVPNEEIGHQGCATGLATMITSDQESQDIVEAFPYVPEPIKVAIAENLLDAIKDTRSKDFTLVPVEQSIQESIPLTTQKEMSPDKSLKAALKTDQETSTVITNDNQIDIRLTRSRGKNTPNLATKLAPDVTSEILELSAVRRSARKKKENAKVADGEVPIEGVVSQDQEVPQISTPRRGRKKKVNIETSEAPHPVEGELQVTLTPRRGLRRTNASQPSGLSDKETPLNTKSVTLPSTTKRTPRRTKMPVKDSENVSVDPKVKLPASSSRRTRKLSDTCFDLSENVLHNQGGETSEPQLPVKVRRGARRRENSVSEITDKSNPDLSQLTLVQAEHQTPVTPKRQGRRRAANLPDDTTPKLIQEAGSPKEKKMPDIRRSTRNTPSKTDSMDIGKLPLESTLGLPDGLSTVRSSKRRFTKTKENQSRTGQLPSVSEESTDEEILRCEQENKEGLHAIGGLNKSSRVTRTRARKTNVIQELSEPEMESFSFATPLSKVTRKTKGLEDPGMEKSGAQVNGHKASLISGEGGKKEFRHDGNLEALNADAKKIDTPVQLKELASDLSSQFVFSPPTLRTRRKNVSSISRIVSELELPIKEDELKSIETVEKQKVKRIRTTKTKQANKATEKESSWSPPPVEIKFISPFASPVDGTKSKPRKTTEASEKVPGRNRKKLSYFPKPVVRRKMM